MSSYRSLWSQQSVEHRCAAAHALWLGDDINAIGFAAHEIARRLNTRLKTIQSQSAEQLSARLGRVTDLPNELCRDLLQAYFFAHQKPMMVQFLDCLGIRHKDGVISRGEMTDDKAPSAARLRVAAHALASKHKPEDIRLYFNILQLQAAGFWKNVGEVDGNRLEPDETSQEKEAMSTKVVETNARRASAELVHHQLLADIDTVRAQFIDAAEKLSSLPGALAEGRAPELVDATLVKACRDAFDVLLARVVDAAGLHDMMLASDELTTLDSLTKTVAAIAEAANSRNRKGEEKRQIADIVSDVRRLHRTDGTGFAALTTCQTDAATVASRLGDRELSPEDEATVHVCSTLLALVRGEQNESDDGAAHVQLVAERYGFSLPLAALQGKLMLNNEPLPPEPPRESLSESGTHDDIADQQTDAGSIKGEQAPIVVGIGSGTAARMASVEPEPVEMAPADVAESKPALPAPHLGRPTDIPDETAEPSAFRTMSAGVAELVEIDKVPAHIAPSATALAQKIATTENTDETAVTELVFHLLNENETGLAYHLARVAAPHLSSELLSAVLLSPHVRDHGGPIARELGSDFIAIIEHPPFRENSPEWNRAMRFLLCAASVPTALLAPSTGACDAFRHINFEDGFKHLWATGNAVVEYAEACRSLDVSVLSLACNESDWNDQLAVLRTRVDDWMQTAASKRFIFGPAGDVWRKWLEQGQLIDRLLQPVRQNRSSALATARQDLERLQIDSNVREEIEHVDRQVLHRHGGSITARAFAQLTRRLRREVLGFVGDWVTLQQNSPKHQDGFRFKQTNSLRNTILRERDAVLTEISDFLHHQRDSLMICATAACCQRSFQKIYALLQQPIPLEEPPLRYVIGADMLRVSGLSLDEEWQPESSQSNIVNGIVSLVASGKPGWYDCLRHRATTDFDHQATDRLIEYLDFIREPVVTVDAMRDFRQREITKCDEALNRDVADTQNAIEYGVAMGVLGESDRNALLARVEAVATGTPKSLRFGEAFRELKSIRANVDARKAVAVEGARRRLDGLGLAKDGDKYPRILRVLEAGDPVTAIEYIDRVLAGDDLPAEESAHDRLREFVNSHRTFADFLSKAIDSDVVNCFRSRSSLAGIQLRHQDDKQADEAASAVEAWFTAKRLFRKGTTEKHCAAIFRGLGFDVLGITEHPTETHKRTWFIVRAAAVRDRNRCPVSIYGSAADAGYRVLCLWSDPPEEDVLNFIGDTHGKKTPAIILYFGVLSLEQRQNLTRICRDQHKTAVVVDDVLMVWASMERPPRLPILFELSLPFTYLEPYTPTAGLVAPEMFYGRRREIESVLNPLGSCFIYGGRQLGKTALLRTVERNWHEPQTGTFVCWIDLKAQGLGFNRSVEEIWPILAKEIRDKNCGIVPPKLSLHADPDRLFAVVKRWLDTDPRRRMLLLLDEADRFLESDATNDFTLVQKLKDWMEKTERRFKVVFAGLHNVQRTTRQANNPLAHFGEPICIGPLLENGEWREARALVECPLGAMGFRFESPDLVTRILSQTNYYPSLIQIYCSQLMRYFGKEKFASFQRAPYVITSRHIEEGYKNQQLRTEIRNRLRWTLDLDKRYRVIAYSIAFAVATAEETDLGTHEGFSVQWIRDQALSIWRKGFKDSQSIDEITTLLSEMVGLGVLRESKPGYFSLRSPNVMNLLGTVDEIFGELEAAAVLEPQPSYEREKFRNGLADDLVRRNPFTAAQESEVRAPRSGALIVFGIEAAGLGDVPDFLAHAVGAEFFQVLDGEEHDHKAFARRLNELNKREVDATTLAYVSWLALWDESWVKEALARIAKLRPNRNFVRAVFMADPQVAWYVTSPSILQSLTDWDVKRQSLGPWHDTAVQQWMDACEFTNSDVRSRIAEVTGRWPVLLYKVYEDARRGYTASEAVDRLEEAMHCDSTQAELQKTFGLTVAEPARVLAALGQYGAALAAEEIVHLIDPLLAEDAVRRSLAWADALRLINAAGQGCWEIDPVVARILGARQKK